MNITHGFREDPQTTSGGDTVPVGPGTLRFALKGFLWSKESDNLAPGSIRFYRGNLERFIAFLATQGVTRLSELDKDHYNLYKGSELEAGRPASGVHAQGRAIKCFLRWLALDEELIDAKIALKVKLPKVGKKLIRPFSLEQIQALLDAAKEGRMPERDTAVLLTFFDTGVRSGELCGLKDSDMEGDRLLIHGKGNKERWARISARTRKAIWSWMLVRNDLWPREEGEDGAIFISRTGAPLDIHSAKLIFRRLKTRTGITGVRCVPHDCRHTFAIEMLRSGADSFEVQKMLGHSTLTMTLNYAKMTDDDTARAHKKHSLVERLARTRTVRRR